MSLTPYRYIGLSVKYKFNAADSKYRGEGAGEKAAQKDEVKCRKTKNS